MYAGLFFGTGTGKTRIGLLLAKGDVLIIAPRTQVDDQNWEREYRTIMMESVKKYKVGETPKVIKPRLTVMTFDEFRRDVTRLKRPNTLIVDEAHGALGVTPYIRWRIKMPVPKASQRFEALEWFIEKHKPDRVYLCTATIIRSPMTVWAAAKILGQLKLTGDFYKFRDKFYIPLPMPGRQIFTSKKGNNAKNDLAEIVRKIGYVGRLEDLTDVPEQTFKTINIELTPKQKARIKQMTLEFPDPLVRVGKVHSIENGILGGNEFSKPEFFDNGKIDAILDLAIEYPRMVIFAKYLSQIDQIASALKKEGKKVLILTGSTKDRGEVIKEANMSEECIFIAQSQISSGWQLGKTKEHPEYYDYNCMIFASMDYSVINRIQGEGRILRQDNLKKNLYITLTVKGGVDEAVAECIASKQDFNERIYLKI